MGLYNFFTSRNPDVLSKDEEEAAETLEHILQRHQYRVSSLDMEDVTHLAVKLYYLSFKRTGKTKVRVEEFVNTKAIFMGNTRVHQYASVFDAIEQTIKVDCDKISTLNMVVTIQECEKTVLATLKTAAKRISEIN